MTLADLERVLLEIDIVTRRMSQEDAADFYGELAEQCASREEAIREDMEEMEEEEGE